MKLKKAAIISVILLFAVISITKISPWAGSASTHPHTIEQTEDKITSVMTLSAGAAATSATLSLLPGDICTPLAEQLAELAKYFVLILSALHLEKFLITLSGFITFGVLIPIACIFLCWYVAFGNVQARTIAMKLSLLGIIIFLIVPASVFLSDKIYQTQADKVNETITEYNNLEIEGDSESGIFSEFTTVTNSTIDKITSFITGLLESLAVMIVTSCIVPALVFVILVWIVKTIFAANVLSLDPKSIDAIFKASKNKNEDYLKSDE